MVTAANRVEIYEILKYKIMLLLSSYPDLVLISGMAEGWDEAIAKIGLREGIPYEVYLPNKTYGQYYWGRKSLLGFDRSEHFQQLIDGCAELHIVCPDIYVDGVHSNFLRNQSMVDTCDHALVYEPKSRGTQDAVRRLKGAKKPYEVFPFDSKLF